ncbi:TolC family protein [Ponticaulis sp.]|uniref:TolC family protein n=1 Tax=Ponticaulis sp. TaxID=2020902 RepID=UPI000B658A9F|nr:TolC family protein [Ponticaulis sp.]MAI91754.1 hypothetical protein [Ponticaulis sp.]OUX97012.1 MAG: hypothetical protein CBB65_15055 [Hyphomonadaceae bacterium TMED5]
MTAGTRPNPVLGLDREGVDGFAGDGSETILSIEQSFDFFGRRKLAVTGADADIRAAQTGAQVERARIASDVTQAYYTVVYTQARLSAETNYRDQLDALLDNTRMRLQAGDAAQYDVERIRQAAWSADLSASRAAANLLTAEADFEAATGLNFKSTEDRLVGDLLPETTVQDILLSGNTPYLERLRAEADAASAREQMAGIVAPDVTIGAGVRRIDGPFDETGLMLGVRVPLPLFDRNQGAFETASAERRSAEARLRLEEQRIRAQAQGQLQRFGALMDAAEAYDATALSSSEELRRIALASYSGGEIAVFEVIDALQSARDAQLQNLDLQHDARAALIALSALFPEISQ